MWTVQQKPLLSLGKDLRAHGESAASPFMRTAQTLGVYQRA